ncbi:MAG: glutamate 5-kinase [Thermodesulfovibrionales bacterium]|nr:glutamate 5-kinase [Thermodesulfovibrionales bacterium]
MSSRIVIKIGSNILADKISGIKQSRINAIAEDVSMLCDEGNEILVVSSGAIAAGMRRLGFKEKPSDIRLKQASAAVGQSILMAAYEKSFDKFNKKVAQVLLTREDLSNRTRYINAKNTLLALLSYDVIPVINENDTVSTEEIKFGDNDQLAALVSGAVDAERLIILSDVDGLYSADPRINSNAHIIHEVTEITDEMLKMAGGSISGVGTGGMYSKILAAKKALAFGITVNIINGRKKGLINKVISGKKEGTCFIPQKKAMSSRKGWIAFATRPKGVLIIDDGAVKAIVSQGKSLLPSGISKVEGFFNVGDPVLFLDTSRRRIAKGIVNYSSADIDKIRGKKTASIESILGYKYADEVVHRDNLAVLI